jgi:hypothetical protein
MPRDIFKLNSGNCKLVSDVTSIERNFTGKIYIPILFLQNNVNPSIILFQIFAILNWHINWYLKPFQKKEKISP